MANVLVQPNGVQRKGLSRPRKVAEASNWPHRAGVRRRTPVVLPAHILLALLAEGGGLACAVPTDDHGVPVPPLEADARVLAAGGITDQHAAFG